jgi:DMSO/TMAO reductase YedYZ molybdopterin-dependent catalytic subunit
MTTADTTTAAGTAAVTPPGAAVTPTSAKATTRTSQKKAAPKAKTSKKVAPMSRKETATKAPKADGKSQARDGSKKADVIQLLRRKEGATAAEIAKLTKWQPHTIRGFISGTVSKKMKLTVESIRNEQGERVYRVR